MERMRKRYPPSFKAKVALEAIREQKTSAVGKVGSKLNYTLYEKDRKGMPATADNTGQKIIIQIPLCGTSFGLER